MWRQASHPLCSTDSHYPIDENVAKTTELVKIAHEHGMSLEAEVELSEERKTALSEKASVLIRTSVRESLIWELTSWQQESETFTGVYPDNWEGLSFETLDAIQQKTGDMPLVLHGGTGIPDDMIKKAISLGVAKINVNTECQIVFAEATREYIEAGKDKQGKGFDPRKLLKPGAEAIMAKVKEKMELFGSVGKA